MVFTVVLVMGALCLALGWVVFTSAAWVFHLLLESLP